MHDNKSKYNHRNKCNVIMSLFLLKYIYMNFDKYCIVNGEGFTVKIDMRIFFFQKKNVDFYLNANWCFQFLLKKKKRKDWSYFYHQSNTDWALCWWSTELFSIFSELRPVGCLLPLFSVKEGVLISSYVSFFQEYSVLSTSVVLFLDIFFISFSSIVWLHK